MTPYSEPGSLPLCRMFRRDRCMLYSPVLPLHGQVTCRSSLTDTCFKKVCSIISSSFYKRLCCLRHGSTHRFPHPMTEDQTMKLLFKFVLGRVGLLPAGREAWLSIPYTGHLPRKLYLITLERYIGTRSMQIVRDLEKAFLPLAHCSSNDALLHLDQMSWKILPRIIYGLPMW